MSSAEDRRNRGFGLIGLGTGVSAGAAAYAIVTRWIDPAAPTAAPYAALVGAVTFAIGFLLLAESGARGRALLPAAVTATLLAGGSYALADRSVGTLLYLTPVPTMFWIGVGMPLSGYLLTTLFKASLTGGAPPRYRDIFFHGLTLPLVAGGAALIALLALILLYAWAGLLRALGVDFFHRLFQEPWFIFPFFGGVTGLAIAMISGMTASLGGLRFLLLLFARILMPITAVFSLTLVAALIVNGPAPIFAAPYPGGVMLALALAGMLIFNGVYQNGEGEPPAAWLRLSTIVALAAFPLYAGLAAYAFWLRIGEYGLTPPRIIGLVVTCLVALYSLVCLAGLICELHWRARRWMPPVAPLNTLMAAVWIAALLLLASPVVNMWEISARSQETLLRDGRIDAAKFDYGYLRFELGKWGEAALDRLAALDGHPQAEEIRAGVSRARAATGRWEYDNPEAVDPPSPKDVAPASEQPESAPEIERLPLNPDGGSDPEAAPTDAPAGDLPQP